MRPIRLILSDTVHCQICWCPCPVLGPLPTAPQTLAESEPLMVRAARGEAVERPPCWMMRQAGRYQQAYRKLAKEHPSFRERSEVTDLIVEISLQPWKSFAPDGVILFSDILTPLSACGIPFEIDDNKGPLIDAPIRSTDGLAALHAIELDHLTFVGESLGQLRNTVSSSGAAVLGFIGSPWTLATYVVEGKSTSLYKVIKAMMFQQPELLNSILCHLTDQLAEYCSYQIESGAHYMQVRAQSWSASCDVPDPASVHLCIKRQPALRACDSGHTGSPSSDLYHGMQIFDSWGGQLPPSLWDKWSRPYLERIIQAVKAKHPTTPLMLYANGSGGLLERMGACGADVIGLDWTVDMVDARKRLGPAQSVQGNVDPALLFADQETITAAVHECLSKAGPKGHILNLGHGVLVGTPEENVAHMFQLAKDYRYQ
jgi:uroporphyrinogen decarboxylase